MEPISRYLADNILSLRRRRGLSQDQLAKMAQIPRSTLTNIESGSGNPSLQNLAKISFSLQVGIEELLSRPRNECELLSAAEVPMRKRGRARVFKLLPDRIKGLEVDRMEIEAGATMGGHPHLPGAKEYLTAVRGEVVVVVSGERFVVAENAVFAFPGDQPHSYHNSGKTLAIAISVVIPVSLGI